MNFMLFWIFQNWEILYNVYLYRCLDHIFALQGKYFDKNYVPPSFRKNISFLKYSHFFNIFYHFFKEYKHCTQVNVHNFSQNSFFPFFGHPSHSSDLMHLSSAVVVRQQFNIFNFLNTTKPMVTIISVLMARGI